MHSEIATYFVLRVGCFLRQAARIAAQRQSVEAEADVADMDLGEGLSELRLAEHPDCQRAARSTKRRNIHGIPRMVGEGVECTPCNEVKAGQGVTEEQDAHAVEEKNETVVSGPHQQVGMNGNGSMIRAGWGGVGKRGSRPIITSDTRKRKSKSACFACDH